MNNGEKPIRWLVQLTTTKDEKGEILRHTTPYQRAEALLDWIRTKRAKPLNLNARNHLRLPSDSPDIQKREAFLFVCRICSASSEATLKGLANLGWDWFTGFLTHRIEICPQCRATRPTERERLFSVSRDREMSKLYEQQ